MDLQGREECPDATEQRVNGVSQELQEFLDSQDDRVHLVCQDKRVTQAM